MCGTAAENKKDKCTRFCHLMTTHCNATAATNDDTPHSIGNDTVTEDAPTALDPATTDDAAELTHAHMDMDSPGAWDGEDAVPWTPPPARTATTATKTFPCD